MTLKILKWKDLTHKQIQAIKDFDNEDIDSFDKVN